MKRGPLGFPRPFGVVKTAKGGRGRSDLARTDIGVIWQFENPDTDHHIPDAVRRELRVEFPFLEDLRIIDAEVANELIGSGFNDPALLFRLDLDTAAHSGTLTETRVQWEYRTDQQLKSDYYIVAFNG